MAQSNTALSGFWRFTLGGVIVVVLGSLSGWLAESLLIAAVALLLWHYANLKRLSSYLWLSRQFEPPAGRGSWRPVFDGIYKLQQRNVLRRRELSSLIRRFREGAEALPDAVLVIGTHHSIVWCNKHASAVLGLRWPEDRGLRIDGLIREPEFGHFIRSRIDHEPMVLKSPIDPYRMLEFRLMAYGEQQRLLVIRDVTRTKQLEATRKEFVANVSHELRTPLTVLKGYMEMLPDEPDPMKQKAFSMMREQIGRMDSLVTQLSELSAVEVRQDDHVEWLEVPEMLEIIISEAETLRGDKPLSISLEADGDLDMRGDRRQMRSAFSNLVFNAVHYTPAGGTIKVKWQRSSRGGLFSVKDDGEGIPIDQIARLTERFYRVDKARSRRTGGSGLGLSIVKHALSNHGSELEIESELGVGSRFRFCIPLDLINKKQP